LLFSVVVHAVVAFAVLHAIVAPRSYDLFPRGPRIVRDTVEQIQYVTVPVVPSAATGPAVRVVPPRPAPAAAPPRLVAPMEIPTGIPVPSGVPTVVDSGRGVAGATGDPGKRGVSMTPDFSDPRIFNAPPAIYSPPVKTQAEVLERQLAGVLKAHRDSVAVANANRRDPTDWTKEIGGQKYGIDSKWIHLGKFQIPTALLALIPVNVQGNPNTMPRDRRINEMSAEIRERAEVLPEARDEVKRINERMIRERAARLKAAANGIPPLD
jgi:hypothetical protein